LRPNLKASRLPEKRVSILCERIIAVLPDVPESDSAIDFIDVAWHELDRRALARQTRAGVAIRIVLPHDQRLEHGAVLARERSHQIVVNLIPCKALVIETRSATDLAQTAYAVGNLHLPAQIEEGRIILPADVPTEAALGRLGISYQVRTRRIRPVANLLPRLAVAARLAK
jgi:urease accessory protein